MTPLTPADFPVFSVGALVYRRTMSSAFIQASSDAVAADIAMRLNRDHFNLTSRFAMQQMAEQTHEIMLVQLSQANTEGRGEE